MVNKINTKIRFKATRHNTPFKDPSQTGSNSGKACLKRKNFDYLKKDSKDVASLASSRREFQSLGAAAEKALSQFPTKCTCEGGGPKRKASSDYIKTWAGS